VNCFQKCEFNLNEINDVEDVRELSIAENDWGKLKAGASFQEYVSSDDNVVRCEVQTLEQMMDEKFTSGVPEEEEEDNMMAALSSIENEVYRVQQKTKKQQLTLMDMWKK
jgi:hypothetical protein